MAYKIVNKDLNWFLGKSTHLKNEKNSLNVVVSSIPGETVIFKSDEAGIPEPFLIVEEKVRGMEHDDVVDALVEGTLHIEFDDFEDQDLFDPELSE